METITPEYAQLNRLLHEESVYGSGSFRWADRVMALRDDSESVTVLDYGCGKGLLRKALGGPDWFREYDPAIEGKDGEPAAADLVVCTDVLEHIEPEMLDNVLKHISRLAQKAVFLVIATRLAKKILADGRNAHLIVEDADWWRETLKKRFFIVGSETTDGEVVFIAEPIRKLGSIIPKSAVSETIRYEQALRNCAMVRDRVEWMPRHERRVAIVAYGPSLQHTWHTLRTERRLFGTTIVTVSGAHDFLIERGIVPDIHIEVDPREHKAFFTRNPHKDTKYWIASCCHPVLIDNIIAHGCDLRLFHVYNSDVDRKLVDKGGPDEGSWLICGGGSVGCRALSVMHESGYRSFSMYGMDCSFDMQGNQHAGAHSGKPHSEWRVKVGRGQRWFRSSGNLVYTARGFLHFMRLLHSIAEQNAEPFIEGTKERVEVFIHGDSLLSEMARQVGEKAAEVTDHPVYEQVA